MKILLINSSYRINGNTSRIISIFEEKFIKLSEELGLCIETEKVHLAHYKINICRGCRVCFDKGEDKCPLGDDLLNIYDKMMQADGYVVASPVYVEDVNGIMKNWMDRMAFNSHRPAFFGKNVMLVTTSGVQSSNHSLKTMQTAFNTWAMNVICKMKFRLGALSEMEEIKSKYDESISRISKSFVQGIEKKSAEKPSLYSLIVFTVQQTCWLKNQQYKDTFDYKYWEEKKWLENGCAFYFPQKSNALKVKIAKIIGKVVAAFFV